MHNTKKNKLILFLVTLVFILPWIFAGYIYKHADRFNLHPHSHGELINPPLQLETDNHLNKWQMIYIADDNLFASLDQLSRIYLALGKDQERLVLEVLFINSPTTEILAKIKQQFPNIIVRNNLKISNQNLDKKLDKILDNQVLIVDPHQNCMISYASVSADPKGILLDLKRLLKLSNIG